MKKTPVQGSVDIKAGGGYIQGNVKKMRRQLDKEYGQLAFVNIRIRNHSLKNRTI